jgi:hypothetical protein
MFRQWTSGVFGIIKWHINITYFPLPTFRRCLLPPSSGQTRLRLRRRRPASSSVTPVIIYHRTRAVSQNSHTVLPWAHRLPAYTPRHGGIVGPRNVCIHFHDYKLGLPSTQHREQFEHYAPCVLLPLWSLHRRRRPPKQHLKIQTTQHTASHRHSKDQLVTRSLLTDHTKCTYRPRGQNVGSNVVHSGNFYACGKAVSENAR